jgi:hypothetical protein
VSDGIANHRDTRRPSGATVLIMRLGLLRAATQLATFAVVLFTTIGWLVGRAYGVPVPVSDATG